MQASELEGRRDTATRHPAVDPTRPFGAHLRMSWWKPLVILIVPALVLLLLQVLLWPVIGAIEGSDDPLAPTLTPLKYLAANLTTVPPTLLAILLVVRMTGAPWRSLLSYPRAFDARRLARYLGGAALLVSAGFGVTALVARDAAGWTTIEITGTTIALLVITVLTTPLQAAGEELWFRGAALPAAASWVRAVRPALAVGLVVSSLAFAVVHGSVHPVLFGYFVLFSVCTGLMSIISGGIEAPVALHVANNVLVGIVNALTAGGGPLEVDRSVGTGAAQAVPLLIVAAVNVAMVALVWARERRARPTSPDQPPHRSEQHSGGGVAAHRDAPAGEQHGTRWSRTWSPTSCCSSARRGWRPGEPRGDRRGRGRRPERARPGPRRPRRRPRRRRARPGRGARRGRRAAGPQRGATAS